MPRLHCTLSLDAQLILALFSKHGFQTGISHSHHVKRTRRVLELLSSLLSSHFMYTYTFYLNTNGWLTLKVPAPSSQSSNSRLQQKLQRSSADEVESIHYVNLSKIKISFSVLSVPFPSYSWERFNKSLVQKNVIKCLLQGYLVWNMFTCNSTFSSQFLVTLIFSLVYSPTTLSLNFNTDW